MGNDSEKSWNLKLCLRPEIKNNWSGESRSRPPGPKTMKITGFRVFPKWILKVINPKRSRIILRSFWANLSIISTIEMVPQTPNMPFFPDFPDFHKAMGPPRQATGPPRSGAGVGVGMLRGKGTI